MRARCASGKRNGEKGVVCGLSQSGGLGRVLLGRVCRCFIACRRLGLRLGACRLLSRSARILFLLDALLRLLRLLSLLRLLRLLTVWALPPLIPAIGRNHTVIVLGVLEEIFCADSVPGRERVLRQGLVFLYDLERGSANLSFGAVALEGRAAPLKTGAPSVPSIPARALVVRTFHTNRLLT